VSVEEYLEREEQSLEKHEYYQGEIFLLAGGTVNHNRIAQGLGSFLNQALRKKNCEAFIGDLRVLIEAHGLYTYPDVMLVCGGIRYAQGREDTIINPVLIAEVLSKSTRDYDRGQKFEFYRAIPSFRDYLLVNQDRVHVEHYAKQPSGSWILREYANLDASVELSSLALALPLSQIYERVEWSRDQT
jgi:Uma2 family endonuclease